MQNNFRALFTRKDFGIKKVKTARFIAEAAVIAALYAALTIILAPISFLPVQIRIAEALTILPMFTPSSIPGLFVGCILANLYSFTIFGGTAWADIVFGSLATLVAAFLSHKMPKPWLVPLPPVIVNGIIVGFVLNYMYKAPLLATMGLVALGQFFACYGLGYPLILLLEKHRDKIFK